MRSNYHILFRPIIVLIFVLSQSIFLNAQQLQLETHWWQPNGQVCTIAHDTINKIVYLGGGFTYIGPREPFGTIVDTLTGRPDFSYANPNAAILVSISDGNGGWFIGGDFTMVGDSIRNRIAHIDALGQVTTLFRIYGCNNSVRALCLNGSYLYAGGDFTMVGDSNRNRIAQFSSSGQLTSLFSNNGFDASVNVLKANGNLLYTGGSFKGFGLFKKYGAVLNNTNGMADQHIPEPNGEVLSAIADGSGGWFIGGNFTKVGDSVRNRIVHINSVGNVSPLFNNAGFNNSVSCLQLKGNTLYAGGGFNGFGKFKAYGALLNNSTGLPDYSFPEPNGNVNALIPDGNGGWYIAGSFTMVGDSIRNNIAQINSSGKVTRWNPNVNKTILTISLSGPNILIGGYFTSIGSISRNYIAAINTTTGLATNWDPNPNNIVYSIFVKGYKVYVGGMFTNIGGQIRNCIAALNLTTGLATSWNPYSDKPVSAIVVNGSNVYVGGTFTTIGSGARNRIAALDTTTGLATAWNPNANLDVKSIDRSLGGIFGRLSAGP